ncbi:MAG: class I SAM-dependent methyltransferase [Patescibacteria group bacterium]|nr:class I SAM-dependent methyltransferase [Patescibacteria group bacterium]
MSKRDLSPEREIGKNEEMVNDFFKRDKENTQPAFYDAYNYDSFWKGRDFENFADQIAVSRLLTRIPLPRLRIIDVGAGGGRLAPLYEKIWEQVVLLDPSCDQLSIAKNKISRAEKIEFVCAAVDSIPLSDASCDAALCVRVFHYITDPRKAIREIGRILIPEGYLILEIPNKIHIKTRLQAFYSSKARVIISSRKPKHLMLGDASAPFVNYHPEVIRDILITEGFDIVEILSVSNFRHRIFKKIIPIQILLFLEKSFQGLLAGMWFGPSIYFLARNNKNIKTKS